MLIFLDTEFTDLGPESELLSIGLISEDGLHEFYAERNDFNPSDCSGFVLAAVVPLFGQRPDAVCTLDTLNHRLRRFVESLPVTMSVACDYFLDWDFFLHAVTLGGELDLPHTVYPRRLNLTDWTSAPGFQEAAEEYFRQGNPRHHALHDARAHRKGYLAAKDGALVKALGLLKPINPVESE